MAVMFLRTKRSSKLFSGTETEYLLFGNLGVWSHTSITVTLTAKVAESGLLLPSVATIERM